MSQQSPPDSTLQNPDAGSSELLALCEEILDDQEVTVDEVRRLGEWLATHEDARRSWPGDVLAGPVQEVLLDGKVNRTELRRLAAVLRRVQRDWTKQRAELMHQAAMEGAIAAAGSMDLGVPALPSIAVTLSVRSHSEKGLTYVVDLSGPSCDCPDWRSVRSQLPKGSLTRCCKHVLEAFTRIAPPGGWPGWFGAFIGQGWRPHPAKRWFILRLGSNFGIACVGGNDWSDVFCRDDGAYQRFGYNIAERRWSYDDQPSAAVRIERAILAEAYATDQVMPTSTSSNPAPAAKPGLLARLFGR